MKGIVTIFQNKRVALPYIFGKYAFPKMKERFCGKLELWHIFHNADYKGAGLDSNKQLGREHVDRVSKWISKHKFFNANILSHKENSKEAPMLPSVERALRLAKEERADLHLFLEDDALVYDPDCGTWATTLGDCDVGLYRNTPGHGMINTAYFLGTAEFDNRLSKILEEYKRGMSLPANKGFWEDYRNKGSQIEHTAFRACRKPAILKSSCAVRHHVKNGSKYRSTTADVKAWLTRTFPEITTEDLNLLDLDGFRDTATG